MGAAAGIGHNNPPGAIERSDDTLSALNAFLAANPVISSEDLHQQGKRLKKQGKAALDDMDAERDSRVRPLNTEVKAINAEYASPKAVLDKVAKDLDRRLTEYARAEEQRRIAEAAEKRRAADEARRMAQETEAREREAAENAAAGEIGVDIAAVTAEADASFRAFEKINRQAVRAERSMSTGLGLRPRETLTVTDAVAAVKAIGLTDKIAEAILSGAREYRREWDALPPGITYTTERTL